MGFGSYNAFNKFWSLFLDFFGMVAILVKLLAYSDNTKFEAQSQPQIKQKYFLEIQCTKVAVDTFEQRCQPQSLYLFTNYYNHIICIHLIRILPFPAIISLLVSLDSL